MRLNKYLAHCEVGTRREADVLIKKGKVTVNGEIMLNPAYTVMGSDDIEYNGKSLTVKRDKVYILMNKPKVFSCNYDVDDHKSVAKILRPKIQNVVTVPVPLLNDDRGLILLTDDKDVIKKIQEPGHRIKQMYELTLNKEMDAKDMSGILDGIEINGVIEKIEGIAFVDDKPQNIVGVESHVINTDFLNMLFDKQGYKIEIIDRMYIAGLTKKNLPRGFWRHLSKKETIFLRHFM